MSSLAEPIRSRVRDIAIDYSSSASIVRFVNGMTDDTDIEHVITFFEDSNSSEHKRFANDLRSTFFGSIRVSQRYFGAFRDFSGFSVDDLMGKALWKLVENAQRFPRCGGRVLCVHGAGSFHRAHPYATRSPRPRTAVDP